MVDGPTTSLDRQCTRIKKKFNTSIPTLDIRKEIDQQLSKQGWPSGLPSYGK